MSMDNDTTRDRVRSAALIGVKQPAAQPDRQALQATGAHPAPCARHCEAQAFRIELRRLHAENEVLRQGYDAARLEIASLKTDHMQALTAYQTTVDNLTAQMEAVGAGGMEPLRKRCLHQISEPAQPVGAAPVGIVAASPGYVGVGWIGGYVPKHNDKLYAAPQPAAQALDAIRYQFLRDGELRDTDLEPFIRLQLNTLWDAKIDAAIAAQQGGANG